MYPFNYTDRTLLYVNKRVALLNSYEKSLKYVIRVHLRPKHFPKHSFVYVNGELETETELDIPLRISYTGKKEKSFYGVRKKRIKVHGTVFKGCFIADDISDTKNLLFNWSVNQMFLGLNGFTIFPSYFTINASKERLPKHINTAKHLLYKASKYELPEASISIFNVESRTEVKVLHN